MQKTFDRLNHVKLFEKLSKRGFSSGVVKVLIDCYDTTHSIVKWVIDEKNRCFSFFIYDTFYVFQRFSFLQRFYFKKLEKSFKWKGAISGFLIFPGSAEALVK